jgi:hypothetical protein
MNHLGKWWMIGAESTGDWMPTTLLSGQADITNQFISVGVHGGLITLIFFIAVIVLCFSKLGLLIEEMENSDLIKNRIIIWAMGAALLSHIVSFMSVSYFDQIIIFWYLLLSMIASVVQVKDSHEEYIII